MTLSSFLSLSLTFSRHHKFLPGLGIGRNLVLIWLRKETTKRLASALATFFFLFLSLCFFPSLNTEAISFRRQTDISAGSLGWGSAGRERRPGHLQYLAVPRVREAQTEEGKARRYEEDDSRRFWKGSHRYGFYDYWTDNSMGKVNKRLKLEFGGIFFILLKGWIKDGFSFPTLPQIKNW